MTNFLMTNNRDKTIIGINYYKRYTTIIQTIIKMKMKLKFNILWMGINKIKSF